MEKDPCPLGSKADEGDLLFFLVSKPLKDQNRNCNFFRLFEERHGISKLKMKAKLPINVKDINEIEIIPLGAGRFELHFKYEEKEEIKTVGDEIATIDLGLDNLVAMTNTKNGEAILVPGKQLKSVNAFWNKNVAKLKSKIEKSKGYEKIRLLKELRNATIKRNRTVTDTLHKISFNVIKYAKENEIGTIVVGHNKEWKQEINIGKRNNQNFVNIPHSKLIAFLKYKAKAAGIKIIEQEESYTSKCDSLALEVIQKHEKYMGRRTKRGIFKSSTGKVVNADINGSVNILRKFEGNDESAKQIIGMGRVFRPMKTRWGQNPLPGHNDEINEYFSSRPEEYV